MDDTQIKLAGIWIALMLTYLLGDVLRNTPGRCTSSAPTTVFLPGRN